MKRKFTQVAVAQHQYVRCVMAIADDGTLWKTVQVNGGSGGWEQMPDLPDAPNPPIQDFVKIKDTVTS